MTKIPNFETSRWRTAAILKIVLSLYLSRKSSDFNEIWYADGGESAFTYYGSSFSQCNGYDVGISQRAGASAGPQAARARRPAPACGPHCSSSICFTGTVLTTCLPRVCFIATAVRRSHSSCLV